MDRIFIFLLMENPVRVLLSKGIDVFSLSFSPRELGQQVQGAWEVSLECV